VSLRTPPGVGGSDRRAYVDSTHSGVEQCKNSVFVQMSGANFALETDFIVCVVAIRLCLRIAASAQPQQAVVRVCVSIGVNQVELACYLE
jgi:hypothetical protein